MEIKQALKIGVTLDHGKYVIEKILGQGGFGITYLAKDVALDKSVAIKEFFPKDFCDRDDTTSHVTLGTTSTADLVSKLKMKFLKEARNIAKLDYPGIIRIHSAFEENNTAYYVMDYIEGETLSTIVKREGPLPVQKAVSYISQIGEALAYIHSKHINHLDIKPANIMIRRRDDRPVLIDFGLSKQYDSEGHQTSTTPTGISHGYAPLEQYKDGGINEFSPATDVYSLAATLYYVLSGKVPPHATELLDEGLTFPESFPEYLQAPILKAMSPKRQSRQETMTKFINQITGKEILPPSEKTKLNVAKANGQNVVHEVEVVEIPDIDKPASNKKSKTSTSQESAPPSGNPSNTSGKVEEQKSEVQETKETYPGNQDDYQAEEEYKSQRTKSVIVWLVTAVIVVILVFWMISYFSGKSGSGVDDYPDNEETEQVGDHDKDIMTMHNILIETPLGQAVYTGEVNADNQPNGHGVATWKTGLSRRYDGQWVNGVMDGEATYELSDGDTFVGTFKNNEYYEGTYTIAESGQYFTGLFKKGQPDDGQWFDKDGKPL